MNERIKNEISGKNTKKVNEMIIIINEILLKSKRAKFTYLMLLIKVVNGFFHFASGRGEGGEGERVGIKKDINEYFLEHFVVGTFETKLELTFFVDKGGEWLLLLHLTPKNIKAHKSNFLLCCNSYTTFDVILKNLYYHVFKYKISHIM